jgi:hypothetical protein
MKKIVRLTEADLARMVKQVLSEQDMAPQESSEGVDINKVMDFAYDYVSSVAPDGPRNSVRYMKAIDDVEQAFNYAIRNLKQNIESSELSLNENDARDPKRIAFFDGLAKQISSKIIGKKYLFGKIGVLDNTSIIVTRYVDRNHAINLAGYPTKELNLFFNVRRVEEDLNRGEKAGTRVWTGLLQISANFVNGKISPNPVVELYPDYNGKTDFNGKMSPSKPWTWDMVGGAAIWANATRMDTKHAPAVKGPGPRPMMQGGLRQVK